MNDTGRRVPIFLIAGTAAGIALAAIFRWMYPDAFEPALVAQLALLPLVLAMAFITPLRDATLRGIDWLGAPSPRRRIVTAIVIGLCAFAYLWWSARVHDRDLTPRLQDEFSYLVQSRLLSRARLWLPSPPEGLADFFETFHVVVKPVYASVYFPGTAMLYVPAAWLNAPHYLTSLAVTAACAAMLYLLCCELLNGAYGILAAMMLTTTTIVRFNSTLALSNMPAMLAAMIVLYAWIKWRKSDYSAHRWAVLMGLIAGWGLIVRPVDLCAHLVPLGAIILFELPKRWRWSAITLLAICALPFLLLQLVFNKGVTGEWFTTPYRFYFDQFQPNTSIGFRSDDPNARVQSSLPQKIDLYETMLRPLIREHRPGTIWMLLKRWRIPFTVSATMPSDLLLVLLPIGIGAAVTSRDRRWWVLLAAPVLFLGLYALYPYFMPYYPLAIAPPLILLILLGIDAIIRALGPNTSSRRAGLTAFLFLAPAALCIAAMPEVRFELAPEHDGIPVLGRVNRGLPEFVQPPAVVLFTYEPAPGLNQSATAASLHIEPVYNYDVANPLDAPIIRAHDLGEARNREIFEYFARVRPQTMFYRMRRGERFNLERLGRADELAR